MGSCLRKYKIYASDLRLYTDASDVGFGAIFGTEWIFGAWDQNNIDNISIDYRELFAITAATFTWGHHWRGHRIVFATDNEPITKVWQKGASPSIPLMSLIRPLYLFAAKSAFSISFKHILGKNNPIADAISRFQMKRFFGLKPDADKNPTALPVEVQKMLASLSLH